MIRLKIKHSICKYEAACRWNCFFEPPDKDWSVKILLKTGTKCLLSEVTDSPCPKLKWSWVCLFIQWVHGDSPGEREGCDGLWCDKQIAIALLSFYKFSRLGKKTANQKKPNQINTSVITIHCLTFQPFWFAPSPSGLALVWPLNTSSLRKPVMTI